jgi:hypothetical protein
VIESQPNFKKFNVISDEDQSTVYLYYRNLRHSRRVKCSKRTQQKTHTKKKKIINVFDKEEDIQQILPTKKRILSNKQIFLLFNQNKIFIAKNL